MFQTQTHRQNSGIACSPEVRRGQVVSLWQRKLFTRCIDKLLPGAFSNGWNRDPALLIPFFLESSLYVFALFPVSSGPWVPESGTARVQRGGWGWKSSSPHGFLHLLRSSQIKPLKSSEWMQIHVRWKTPSLDFSWIAWNSFNWKFNENLQTSEWMLLCTATTR